jgi:hypothetical protein
MNIEGFGYLPDGFSLADESLRQFCMLGIELARASEADPPVPGHVAAGLGAFPDEVAFKLGDPRKHGHDQLAGMSCRISLGFGQRLKAGADLANGFHCL